MFTKAAVAFFIVSIIPVSYEVEETLTMCPETSECVNRAQCPYFKKRYIEYKRTENKDILNELKALKCNEEEKAVCCTLSCGKPQSIPESVNITRG